jgi:hypothetical protein
MRERNPSQSTSNKALLLEPGTWNPELLAIFSWKQRLRDALGLNPLENGANNTIKITSIF